MIGLGLEENVSQGMKNIGDSIETVSSKSAELEKVSKRIDDISKRSLPAKRELKQLQELMANMNLKGLSNTEEFTRAAQRAGELKDAMSDARQAVSAYSNDVMSFKAAGEVFTGIAAAGSVATGVMGMFGAENERVKEVLLKVQSAQAILNGVTAIANVLNKDSVIMLKLKQIRQAASVATTKADTVATNINTAAQTANNAATAAGTVKQTAWNTAKAIGKAMLGDFTGLLLLGAAGLITYSMATSDATEETEKQTLAQKNATEMHETYVNTLSSTYAKLMTTFTKLKGEWENITSIAERTNWIKQHKSELENLGIEAKNVNSVEEAFTKNTEAVVEGFKKRARAAAYQAMLEKAYTKQIELEEKYQEQLNKHGKSAGDKVRNYSYNTNDINWDSNNFKHGRSKNGNYETFDGGVTWTYTVKGAKEFNVALKDNVAEMHETYTAYNENELAIQKYGKMMGELTENERKWVKANVTTAKTVKETRKPIEGSVGAMRNKLQELQNDLRDGFIRADKIEETKSEIKKLTEDIEKKEIELGLKEPKKETVDKWANSLYNQTSKRLKEIEEQLQHDSTLTLEARAKLINEANELQRQLDDMSNNDDLTIPAKVEPKFITKGSYEDIKQSIQNGMSQINDIADDYDLGLIDYNEATKRIRNINRQLVALGAQPYIVEIESKFGKELQSFMNGTGQFHNAISSIDGVVGAFDRLEQSIKNNEDGWKQFMAAVNAAYSVIEAVSTIMTILDGIQTAMNVTNTAATTIKEKEAIASSANAAAQDAEAVSTAALATANGAAIAPMLALALATKKLAGAQIFQAHASIPFVGPPAAAAGVATMEATLAAISAFAEGGIVGGKYSIGDRLLVRANKGEMILNGRQQANLFKALDQGLSSNQVQVIGGELKVRGSDLVICLKNETKKTNLLR